MVLVGLGESVQEQITIWSLLFQKELGVAWGRIHTTHVHTPTLFFFLGLYTRHMQVLRLGVELEPCLRPPPQLVAMLDP